MNLIQKLKSVGTLSNQDRTYKFVSTGSLALNRVISGKFSGGIPVPGMTQFIGESSTAKSAFATKILANAQKLGYHTLFEDAENTLNSEFALSLGLDPEKTLYNTPESIEEAFDHMEKVIKEIRETDKETPIVVVLDSLAVLCSKSELESKNYDQSPVDGALRAKLMGGSLRKFDKIVKSYNVGFVVVNQQRSKIGVMYGDPTTAAAGGRGLEYYLSVNLKTLSSKSDHIEVDNKIIGITGRVKNTKNKISIPLRECEFRLTFNEGFDELEGLLPALEEEGLVTRSAAWYTFNGVKFQKGDFVKNLRTDDKFSTLRRVLGLSENTEPGTTIIEGEAN